MLRRRPWPFSGSSTDEMSPQEQAQLKAQELLQAMDVLLSRLFYHLSQLQEEDEDGDDDPLSHKPQPNSRNHNKKAPPPGMTLPAQAVSFLCHFYLQATQDNYHTPLQVLLTSQLKDSLRLLQFLLPRCNYLRIVNDPGSWPPSKKSSRRQASAPSSLFAAQETSPPNTESTSTPPETIVQDEDAEQACNISVLTTETTAPLDVTPADFLEFLQEPPNLRNLHLLFPNLQTLVLYQIPAQWLCLHKFRSLQVIRYEAAYLERLLPLPVHSTLTHLKLSHVGLTNATLMNSTRIWNRLAPTLQVLNLSHNLLTSLEWLHSSKLCGTLQELDVSHNRLTTILSTPATHSTTKLKHLNLSHNPGLHDIEGIVVWKSSLQRLEIQETGLDSLQSLQPLARLQCLERLQVFPIPCLLALQAHHGEIMAYRSIVFKLIRNSRSNSRMSLEIDGQKQLQVPLVPAGNTSSHQHRKRRTKLQKVKATANRNGIKSKKKQKRRPVKIQGSPASPPAALASRNKPIIVKKASEASSPVQVQVDFGVSDILKSMIPSTSKPELGVDVDTSMEENNHNTAADLVTPKKSNAVKKKGDEPYSVPIPVLKQPPEPSQVEAIDCNSDDNDDDDASTSSISRDAFFRLGASLHEQDVLSSSMILSSTNTTTTPLESSGEGTSKEDNTDGTLIIPTVGQEHKGDGEALEQGDPSFNMERVAQALMQSKEVEEGTPSSPAKTKQAIIVPLKSPAPSLSLDREATVGTSNVSSTKTKKVGTVTLQKKEGFDALTSDWDTLVENASKGLIPNGRPKVPVASLSSGDKPVFSEDVVNLLEPKNSNKKNPFDTDNHIPSNKSVDSGSTQSHSGTTNQTNGLLLSPNQSISWQDDQSVLTSLTTDTGTAASAPADPIDTMFQQAEQNTPYDGPDTCREMNVHQNLDLYFQSFVFYAGPLPSLPDELLQEMIAGHRWETVPMRFPRIQLLPQDRRSMVTSAASHSQDLEGISSSRESLVYVWQEQVVPCGKPALRRLRPNRRVQLGFHGQVVVNKQGPIPYAHHRSTILCLSNQAFYVMVDHDAVTESKAQKSFPAPIPSDKQFHDAPWPHAVARHLLVNLEAITIGFGFQRLVLRFAGNFVYVLLTANKMETVQLLQEIQNLCQELKATSSNSDDLISFDNDELQLDNDDAIFYTALEAAVEPLGVVLHYQLVQQIWKRGNRGTVRRVCVVTDSKLYLLNEEYVGDGSTSISSSTSKQRLGDVSSYSLVDETDLEYVEEVQAANQDPNAITFLINPNSKFKRTHRWRLVCRDPQGAEQLVESVRKALRMANGGDS